MNSKDLYIRLLRYVLPYRKAFLFSLLATAAFAATEPAMPALMKPLLDESFVADSSKDLLHLPLLLIGLFFIRGIASFISGYGMKLVAIFKFPDCHCGRNRHGGTVDHCCPGGQYSFRTRY